MTDEERAIEITGGSARSLEEALDQWEAERQALAELYDENQSLVISFRHFDVAAAIAEQIIAAVELDASMFIKPATREKIEQFREQIKQYYNRRAFCREIKTQAAQRQENPHHV